MEANAYCAPVIVELGAADDLVLGSTEISVEDAAPFKLPDGFATEDEE